MCYLWRATFIDKQLFAITASLIALCGCNTITSGKRAAMRPAVQALVKANTDRDNLLGGPYLEELQKAAILADTFGDRALAGDVIASQDLNSCVQDLSVYRDPMMQPLKDDIRKQVDVCVAALSRQFL
jgi:hypothetical protein